MRSPSITFTFALLILTAGCGGETRRNAEPPQAPNTIQIDGEEATDRGTTAITGFQQVPIEAGSFFFSPTLITGPPGQEIELTVTPDGAVHNLSLPEQGIDEDLAPATPLTLSVTMPETGTVVFFCSFHRERGMLGGLTAA